MRQTESKYKSLLDQILGLMRAITSCLMTSLFCHITVRLVASVCQMLGCHGILSLIDMQFEYEARINHISITGQEDLPRTKLRISLSYHRAFIGIYYLWSGHIYLLLDMLTYGQQKKNFQESISYTHKRTNVNLSGE